MAREEIVIIIKGRPSYERWTIYQWILEYKDLLEEKYGVKFRIVVKDDNNKYPQLIINKHVIDEPPFEEGYLLEVIESLLNQVLVRE